MAKRNLHEILFPRQRKILHIFGENLYLAMKRRGYSKSLISERTGFDPKTISKVLDGDPGVSIGTYLKVMGVLGMDENFLQVAAFDEVGMKLQDAKLLGSKE